METQSKFFEAFKKQQSSPRYNGPKKSSREFFFALLSDDIGVYVKTVSRSLKEKKVRSENYTDSLKYALELYEFKKSQTKLIVDWSNPHSNVYLFKHPDLMESLTVVDNLIDHNGKAIYCGSRSYPLVLNIVPNNDALDCSITLCESKIDTVITENYSLVGDRILSTLPIGGRYKSILDLNSNIIHAELEQYLSIVYTNFINITLKYKSYKVVTRGECELESSLVIESIDSSGFMAIKTSYSYSEYITPEFYQNFRPTKLVHINKNTDEVVVSNLFLPDTDVMDKLIKTLYYLEDRYSLSDSFNIEEDGVLINPELSTILFNSELKILIENFDIYGEKVLRKNKIKRAKVNLELLLRSGIDYLQGSAILNVSGEELELFNAVTLFNKHGYIPLKNGTRALLNRGYIDRIKKVIREGREGIEVSIFDMSYIEDTLEARVSGDEFIKRVNLYKKDFHNSEVILNLEGFRGKLREYQILGVKWMLKLHQIGISGCLSDDMGLGKTVQTIAFLKQVLHERDNRPILIVMPKTLIFNWIKEVEKFSPDLDIYSYYGPSRDTKQIHNHIITLTTYHTLRNDIDKIKDIDFFYTILDEIQNIKNHTSLLAKASYLVNSQYKLGISGTPVENSLADLYSISKFLNPTLFGSFKKFKDEWSGPIASEDSEVVNNILRSKIKPLFLRRLKEDVLCDLPPKSEQVIYIDMNKKQTTFYEKVRKQYHNKICLKIREEGIDKSQLTIIKAFMELRQIATIPEYKSNGLVLSAKKEVLLEQLYETIDCGHKVLIFSNFLSAIKGLSESLSADGIDHRIITGATNKRERVVEEFMDDSKVKVLIMTLKTGGVGLNLTAASYVYIMDPWWNIASENQAIDRIHRIGQKSSVFCYRYITRGTIEEKILQLQDKKRALFNNLFTTSKSGESGFNMDDIDYLLG